jgi:hypothetical protein
VNVLWGNNQLSDCVALLSWQDELVLSVSVNPLRVSLRTPSGATSKIELDVTDNRVIKSTGKADVSVSPTAIAVVKDGSPILMAQDLGNDTVMLHTDLRPLGMNIFDDASGLHIGGSILANNRFAGCSTAIALG